MQAEQDCRPQLYFPDGTPTPLLIRSRLHTISTGVSDLLIDRLHDFDPEERDKMSRLNDWRNNWMIWALKMRQKGDVTIKVAILGTLDDFPFPGNKLSLKFDIPDQKPRYF